MCTREGIATEKKSPQVSDNSPIAAKARLIPSIKNSLDEVRKVM